MKSLIITNLLLFFSGFTEASAMTDCKMKKNKDEATFCLAMVYADANMCNSIANSENGFSCRRKVANLSHHIFNAYSSLKTAPASN
jgi:hypothetical protein